MQPTRSRQLFTYNASALGVGGAFEGFVVPSLASVSLSPSGGVGSAVEENYDRGGVSFTRAESQVTGFRSGDIFTTTSRVSITNLALFGRLRIAFMRVMLQSTRDINQPSLDASEFDVETEYRGVMLDRTTIAVESDPDLCGCRTFRDVAARVGRTGVAGFTQQDVASALKENRAPLQTSVVRELTASGLKPFGNILPVSDFGVLRFGEQIVNQGHRRVNLLRVDFGVAGFDGGGVETPPKKGSTGGTLTVGSSDTNGAPVWPLQGG
jgi:hypothetical protein